MKDKYDIEVRQYLPCQEIAALRAELRERAELLDRTLSALRALEGGDE